MEKGTNRKAPPPYSTVAAATHAKCRPGAVARDGSGGRIRRDIARGAAADGGNRPGSDQPGV